MNCVEKEEDYVLGPGQLKMDEGIQEDGLCQPDQLTSRMLRCVAERKLKRVSVDVKAAQPFDGVELPFSPLSSSLLVVESSSSIQ